MSPHHLNTEAPQTCYWPAYQLYTNHMIQHIWTISCILEWTGVFKVLHHLVQILFVLQKLESFFGRPLLPDPGNPANGPLSRPDVSICTSPQNCTTTPHQQVAGVHPLLFVLFITIMPLMYGDISHKSREYLCQYLVKGWKWWYQNLSEAQFISKFIPP